MIIAVNFVKRELTKFKMLMFFRRLYRRAIGVKIPYIFSHRFLFNFYSFFEESCNVQSRCNICSKGQAVIWITTTLEKRLIQFL